MTPSTPSPSISPPTRQPGSPQQPIYGGNTTPGRISMTNGHQLASAKRRPDSTILVYTLPAPLRRLRFAVYRRPLLRGLALLPAQIGDTIALLRLERTTTAKHPDPDQPQPATADPRSQVGDARSLAATAGLVAVGWPLGGVLGTQLTLSGAAALGGHLPWLPSLLAAVAFAVRPIVRWWVAKRTAGDDLAVLHGAEHQAINCVRQGLALTDDNIAASPVESPNCDSSLQVTDQIIFVPSPPCWRCGCQAGCLAGSSWPGSASTCWPGRWRLNSTPARRPGGCLAAATACLACLAAPGCGARPRPPPGPVAPSTARSPPGPLRRCSHPSSRPSSTPSPPRSR